jgi:hypothetical protein
MGMANLGAVQPFGSSSSLSAQVMNAVAFFTGTIYQCPELSEPKKYLSVVTDDSMVVNDSGLLLDNFVLDCDERLLLSTAS